MQYSYFCHSSSKIANFCILDHVRLGKLFRPTMFMDHIWIASQAAIFLDIIAEYSTVLNCLPTFMSFSIFFLLVCCSSIVFCWAFEREMSVHICQFLFTSKDLVIKKLIRNCWSVWLLWAVAWLLGNFLQKFLNWHNIWKFWYYVFKFWNCQ